MLHGSLMAVLDGYFVHNSVYTTLDPCVVSTTRNLSILSFIVYPGLPHVAVKPSRFQLRFQFVCLMLWRAFPE
jgi:hypothetical protein